MPEERRPKPLSRREFIQRVALLGAGSVGAGLLGACGGTPATPPAASGVTAAPAAATGATAAPAAAAGATAAPAAAGGTTQIEFWHGFAAHEIAALQKMLDQRFSPKHPKIKVNAVGGVTEEKLLTAISGGNPPDVALLPSSGAIGTWAHNGVLLPLNDQIKASSVDLNAYVPAGLSQCQLDGKYYALPFVNFNNALYWNKDLFKAAGLDPETPPKTTDELPAFAEKLTKPEGGTISQIGTIPNLDLAENAWRFGGDWYDAAGKKVTADTPNNRRALQFQLDLTNKMGGTEAVKRFQASLSSGGGAADNPFYLGKIAMVRDGCWQVAFIKQYAPKLNYGVASFPAPQGVTNGGTTNDLQTNPIALPKGVKHPNEGWELLRFLSTDVDTDREYAGIIANIPHLKEAFTNFTTDPRLKVFVDLSAAPGARHFPVLPIAGEYRDAIGTLESSVLTGETKLEAGFAQLQTDMQKALDKASR